MSDETMMEEEQQGETVAIPNELAEVEETEDGGAFVRLEEMELSQEQRLAHFANIVEEVDQNKLNTANRNFPSMPTNFSSEFGSYLPPSRTSP